MTEFKFKVGTLLTRKPGKSMPVDCVAEIFMVVEIMPNGDCQILEGEVVQRWGTTAHQFPLEEIK